MVGDKNSGPRVKQKMGIKKLMRATALGALVMFYDVTLIVKKRSHSRSSSDLNEKRKSASDDSIKFEPNKVNKNKNKKMKLKNKRNNNQGELVTDAIPSRNQKFVEDPESSEDFPLHTLVEVVDDIGKEQCENYSKKSLGSKKSNSSSVPSVKIEDVSDEEDYDNEKYPDDDPYLLQDQEDFDEIKRTFPDHDRQNSNDPRKSGEDNSQYSYQACKNTYYISRSKDVHIGPIYKQQLIVNGVEQGFHKSKRAIKETKDIKAIKENGSPITKDMIHLVAGNVGLPWTALGRNLGYNDAEIEQFDIDYKGHREKVYQLLRDWIQYEADKATCAKLSKALWDADAKEAVEKLAKFVGRQNEPSK